MAETKKRKSADKKSNTQSIKRSKYITLLQGMQEDSQTYLVLKHLIKKGHTTSLEIATLFYITNPTAVISDLRKKGAEITASRVVPKQGKPYHKLTLEV